MEYEDISLAVFDLDGTIFDTVPYKLAQNQHLARQFGKVHSIEQSRRIWNDSEGFEDLMFNVTGEKDMELIMPLVERDYNMTEFQKRLFPFTLGFLESLAGQRFHSALITNASQQILDLDAQTFSMEPLSRYFEFVQTADSNEFKKPDPRTFDRVLGYFGVVAAQAVYIGDEIKDARAAIDAGMQFIGVETGLASRDEFESIGVTCCQKLTGSSGPFE